MYCLRGESTSKGQQVHVPRTPGGRTTSKAGDLTASRDSCGCGIALPAMQPHLLPFSFLPQASALPPGVSGTESNNLPWQPSGLKRDQSVCPESSRQMDHLTIPVTFPQVHPSHSLSPSNEFSSDLG